MKTLALCLVVMLATLLGCACHSAPCPPQPSPDRASIRGEIVIMGMGAVLQNRACDEVAEAVFEAAETGAERAMIVAADQKCRQAAHDTVVYADAAIEALENWNAKACDADAGTCSGTAGQERARALEGCVAKAVLAASPQYVSAANFLKMPIVVEEQDAMTLAARLQNLAPNSGCDHLLDE